MRTELIQTIFFEAEIKSTRSSGPGGQHVNKTASAIQVKFSIIQSTFFSEEQKQKLLARLSHRLVQDEFLMMRSEEERDQNSNKKKAVQKLADVILNALKDPKKRVKTKIPFGAKIKRKESKQRNSEIKKSRHEKIKW